MQQRERGAPPAPEPMDGRSTIPAPALPDSQEDIAAQMMAPQHSLPPLSAPPLPTGEEDFVSSVRAALHLVAPARSTAARHRERQQRWHTAALVAYDALMVNIGFLIAYYLRFVVFGGVIFAGSGVYVQAALGDLLAYQAALTAAMLLLLAARGMYRLRATRTLLQQGSILFVASTTCFASFSIYDYLFRATQYELVKDTRAIVVFTWLAAMVVPFMGRLALVVSIALLHRIGLLRTRLLVIGGGRAAKVVMQHFAALPGLGFRVLGFIPDAANGTEDFGRFKALGELADCARVLRGYRVGEVIIALPAPARGQLARAIAACEEAGIPFHLVPDIHNLSLARVDLEAFEGIPMLRVRRGAEMGWQFACKRALDCVIAVTTLTVGLPIWALLALIIRLDSPGPLIYRQQRIGQGGVPFTSYKFRSMVMGADTHKADLAAENAAGRGLFKLKRDPRCTRVGRWLRRMSLDEVPQLWNVLRGEMSIVGPRPPLPEEVARYEDWERRRLDLPPGLTGLWQVRGRSDIGFDEMVLMDIFYVENWSFRLDVEILLKTIPVVLFSRGAY
ncbi:MAG: sugar transferase [Ktedonobacterales bacterium]|nr:sugar transferase [Ktedonobacterales bacterium]